VNLDAMAEREFKEAERLRKPGLDGFAGSAQRKAIDAEIAYWRGRIYLAAARGDDIDSVYNQSREALRIAVTNANRTLSTMLKFCDDHGQDRLDDAYYRVKSDAA
jgi:hypothetical protein